MHLNKKSLWEAFCNLITAIAYLWFIINFAIAFKNKHEISILLYAIFDTIVIVILLARGMPKSTSTNLVYWAAAMGGSWSSLFLHPYPSTPGTAFFLIPQIIGICISFAGLLSLNKSFGLMASNRGIRTNGIYRYIRHPLYTGYILANISLVVQHFSYWNLAILIFNTIMEIWRLFIEENFLGSDPLYAAYMKTTKWRMIPGVW